MTTWLDRLSTLSDSTCDTDILDNLRHCEESAVILSKKVENVRVTCTLNEGLAAAIGECLDLHAEAIDQLGTEFPERLPQVPPELRAKIARQRERVDRTLSGASPAQHVAHLESLNAGLRLLLKRLAPRPAQPPSPPPPVWDPVARKWRVPK